MKLIHVTRFLIFSIVGMFFTALPQGSALTQPHEVFRLTPRLRYDYNYYKTSGGSTLGTFSYFNSDSGTIVCTLLDSVSINDTTRSWLVSQSSYLVHRRRTPYIDTVWNQWDSSSFHLNEVTTGYHELQCSTAVWKFPEVRVGYPPTQVFRYDDTPNVLTVRSLWRCDWFALPSYDSVWLSVDSSFSHRELFYCFGDMETNSYYHLSISLRSLTIVSVDDDLPIPLSVELLAPFPNPFNPRARIQFHTSTRRHVIITIVDILGREIDRVFDGSPETELTTLDWDSKSHSSGVYFVIMETEGYRTARKLLLIR